MDRRWKLRGSGMAAGLVNGLFGGGGGMVLLPLLSRCGVTEKTAFATSLAVMWPLCALSAAIYAWQGALDLRAALPCLLGGFLGGLVGGRTMAQVPVLWLRRIFAAFLLYGGVRYLL